MAQSILPWFAALMYRRVERRSPTMAFFNDLTGTLLDRRYQITGLLGKGGMGHVYAATHVALEQKVAIKVLHPRYATEERFRERFIREARSASRIQHRNVVRITDFGDTPDGSVYFVMELLEGHDVGEVLRDTGAMAWPRTRHILLQAIGALRAAHAKDIIHRDIKPGNCFLTVDKEEGTVDFVKLLDFGIAKVGSDSHADAQGKGLTGTGEVFGTASYMAPEQARGGELDARSDMYSLGIMAYEMLTGRVPFTGVNSIHVITKHLNEAPVPPRTHEPSIPAEVEAVVLTMIAKEASQRYDSMSALEQALRSIPESAGPPVRRTQIWGGSGHEPAKPVVASGTLARKTEPPVRAAVAAKAATPVGGTAARTAVAAKAAKPAGGTAERTAVVSPRVAPAGAGAVHKKGPVVGAPRAPAAKAAAKPMGGTAERTAVVSPRVAPASAGAVHKGPVVGAPRAPAASPSAVAVRAGASAVAPSTPGSRDRSVPPPSATPAAPPATPPRGATMPVVPGGRDRSVPPPGAVAHAVGGSHDLSAPRGAVAHAVPSSQDRSVPLGLEGQPLPGSHDRSAPPGHAGWPAPVVPHGGGEGTHPPPGGRDRSVPPPSAWSSSTASTGPLARVGDSSTETSPQSLQVAPAPLLTGRMIVVVAGLVLLVGAGSAVGTMAVLSSRNAVEPAASPAEVAAPPAEPAASPAEVVAPPQGVEPEDAKDLVEDAAVTPVEPTTPAGDGPMPAGGAPAGVAMAGVPAGEGTTTADEVAATTGDHASSSAEPGSTPSGLEDDGEAANAEPAKASEGAVKQAPKRPMHETAECKQVRDDAAAAHKARQWAILQTLTRKNWWCWSEAGKAQRVRWSVMSLYELKLYSKCIKAGGSSKDAEVQAIVGLCKKELTK